jgi:hypothetical protein
MGVQAQRVIKPAELEEKLQWLLDSEGPALLEVVTDQKIPVLPMVPGGNALHEFILYDESMLILAISLCTTLTHSQRSQRNEEPAPRSDQVAKPPS